MDQEVSHVSGVPCEDETDKHNVKSYHFVIKLCSVGAWLREKEYGDCCRHGNVGFTANKNPSNHCPRVRRDTKWKKVAKLDLLDNM